MYYLRLITKCCKMPNIKRAKTILIAIMIIVLCAYTCQDIIKLINYRRFKNEVTVNAIHRIRTGVEKVMNVSKIAGAKNIILDDRKSAKIIQETCPYTSFSKNLPDLIKKSPIINALKSVVTKMKKKTILTIFITSSYISIYLNWLSRVMIFLKSMDIPENHLLVTLDKESCDYFQKLNMNKYCMQGEKLFGELKLKTGNSKSQIKKLWDTRILTIWLLGFWGYNVMHFDADAIPYRENFMKWFESRDVDIVAGSAAAPRDVFSVWRRTFSFGSLYLKSMISSPGVYAVFRTMSLINSSDDQTKLNLAIMQQNIIWSYDNKNKSIATYTGINTKKNLRVIIVPYQYICRFNCKIYFDQQKLDDMLVVQVVIKKLSESNNAAGTKEIIFQEKYMLMKRYGLWHLKDDILNGELSTPKTVNLAKWIKRISK